MGSEEHVIRLVPTPPWTIQALNIWFDTENIVLMFWYGTIAHLFDKPLSLHHEAPYSLIVYLHTYFGHCSLLSSHFTMASIPLQFIGSLIMIIIITATSLHLERDSWDRVVVDSIIMFYVINHFKSRYGARALIPKEFQFSNSYIICPW